MKQAAKCKKRAENGIHPFPALFLFAQSYLTDAVIGIFSDYCFTDTYLSTRRGFYCRHICEINGLLNSQENVARAVRAAACSASFLLCPEPEPMGTPLSSTSARKTLAWSGPCSPAIR